MCGEAPETIEHLLLHCVRTKLIWKLAPVGWEVLDQITFSFKKWWRELSKAMNKQEMDNRQELTTYLLWHIWKAWNCWNFNAGVVTELEVVQGAMDELMEYKTQHPRKQ